MIPIERVYLRINNDLARKGKAGYSSSDEFNRDVRDCQNLLFEFYAAKYDQSQAVKDSLAPFFTQADIAIGSGVVAFPSGYRHLLMASFLDIQNVAGSAKITVRPMQWLSTNEVGLTLASAIRKPVYPGRLAFEQISTGIKVYPETLSGSCRLHYLAAPPEAKRGYTVNLTTFEEDLDVPTTIDLVWGEQDETNLIDLLLFFKGIQIRETELLQWIGMKKQISE